MSVDSRNDPGRPVPHHGSGPSTLHPLQHPRCKRIAGEEIYITCLRCDFGPCSVAPARYLPHEVAPEAPNRLKGTTINQDGDAT